MAWHGRDRGEHARIADTEQAQAIDHARAHALRGEPAVRRCAVARA
jgi:hypothetical protein